MEHLVYKLVQPVEGQRFFASYYDAAITAYEYELGKKKESKTPIFVYADIESAYDYASDAFNPLVLLQGITTTEPKVYKGDILVPRYLKPHTITTFWLDARSMSSETLFNKYGNMVMSCPENTCLVYDFTPMGIITRHAELRA